MKPLVILAGACCVAAALALPAEGRACSPMPIMPFEIDGSSSDATPPGPMSARVDRILRGKAEGDSAMCSDLGVITLHVGAPAGEDPAETGYLLEIVAGASPRGAMFPPLPIAPFPDDETIVLTFIDGICEEQEPIAFTLRFVPLDRAGNEGPPFDLAITDPGRSPGAGCGGSGGTGGSGGGGGAAGGSEAPPVEGESDRSLREAEGGDEAASGCSAAGSAGVYSLAWLALVAGGIGKRRRSAA
ncbi:hypothetical protein [Vulgatibacter sp.]|uniref:hypothetical protein n=1 Tax=Vulgatibacter sp. TaxID=1971226 RepID=UPI003568EAE4